MGEEAEEAQDAQIVLGDALRRLADEPYPPRGEIGAPADVVEQPPLAVAAHRVDGEVAPRRVGLEVVAERDLGVAPVGRHILAAAS